MPFRAELNYTKQDMKQFDKVHQKLRYGLWYALSNLLLILGCLAVLTSGVLAFALGVWSREIGLLAACRASAGPPLCDEGSSTSCFPQIHQRPGNDHADDGR